MGYIWQNSDWPHFVYDSTVISASLALLESEREKTDYAYSVIDTGTKNTILARNIAEDIVSSLSIEGEKIDYESVYSSAAKHLDVVFMGDAKNSLYADTVYRVVSDALENHEKMTHERLFEWNTNLFINKAGVKPKVIGAYRTSPEYVMKYHKMEGEVVYEAVCAEKVPEEMDRLLDYINADNGISPFVKAAVSSLWFVLIHPFEDGNGRISRALADYIISRDYGSVVHLFKISTGILKDRSSYYEEIQNVSSGDSMDITAWVVWFLDMVKGCIVQVRETLRKTLSVTAFMKSLDPNEYNSREMSMLYRLSDGSFFGKLTREKWAKLMKCSDTAAFRDIQHLVEEGFLIPTGENGKKAGYYFNSDAVLKK